ncbi:hypothetical protein EC973_001096, partial [Apophysomyces ossiformis]
MQMGLPLAAVSFSICAIVQAGVIPNRGNNYVASGNDDIQAKERYTYPEIQGNVAGYKRQVDEVVQS